MEDKLRRLGLRLEGDFPLHSGGRSSVFWDVEKLFNYPYWARIETIRPFIYGISIKKPALLVGIRRGGYLLAKDIGECLSLTVMDDNYICNSKICPYGCLKTILIDDCMTTGGSVRKYLKNSDSTIAVAILVNRSGLSEIDGIPIISGIHADEV